MELSQGNSRSKEPGICRNRKVLPLLFVLSAIVCVASLALGRYGISVRQIVHIVGGKITGQPLDLPGTVEMVLFKVRIPRIAAAMLVGSALSLAGVSYQGMFRNPMVSSDILGASAGAGFGAALSIVLSLNSLALQFMAFAFGLGAVLLTYMISLGMKRRAESVLTLLLAGLVVSALFTSCTSLIKYVADPYSKLPAVTFWMMGGLSSVTARDTGLLLIPLLLGTLPLLLIRWQMNVMTFGEEEARALGVNVLRVRIVVILCSTLLTAAAVSVSGMIGWVGLLVPHMSRLLVGADFKVLMPVSMLLGSLFLLVADDLVRSAFPQEIPLGILTALIGAPCFLYLLLKGGRSWL
jgi:iron complex transport system permease protein